MKNLKGGNCQVCGCPSNVNSAHWASILSSECYRDTEGAERNDHFVKKQDRKEFTETLKFHKFSITKRFFLLNLPGGAGKEKHPCSFFKSKMINAMEM